LISKIINDFIDKNSIKLIYEVESLNKILSKIFLKNWNWNWIACFYWHIFFHLYLCWFHLLIYICTPSALGSRMPNYF